MTEKQTVQMLARFGPLDALMEDMIKTGSVKDLIALTEPIFNAAFEWIRRKHLEANGYKFQDPDNPATCESCEG